MKSMWLNNWSKSDWMISGLLLSVVAEGRRTCLHLPETLVLTLQLAIVQWGNPFSLDLWKAGIVFDFLYKFFLIFHVVWNVLYCSQSQFAARSPSWIASFLQWPPSWNMQRAKSGDSTYKTALRAGVSRVSVPHISRDACFKMAARGTERFNSALSRENRGM